MNKQQTKPLSIRCKARTNTGKQCKKMSVPGYEFCKVHGFGKLKGVPVYENAIFLAVIGLILSSIVGLFIARHYFLIGPSIENQNKILTKQDEVLNIPPIALDIGPVLDPKDPWGTSFVIYNQSHQIISNVWAVAYWRDLDASKTDLFSKSALNPVPEILPTGKQGLHFASIGPPVQFHRFGSRTFVNIDIRFTPDSLTHETNQTFQFCVAQDHAGNYVWIPSGEGQSLKFLFTEMDKQELRIIDTIPLLDVRVDSIDDISLTNKNYPIQISYSWKNTGGEAATAVYIEWAATHLDNSPYIFWNHHGDTIVNTLWPGMTNRASRIYTEGPARDVLRGITNGNLALSGVAFFKDPENHDYSMLFKAIRTNNEFRVSQVGVGGYFLEIEKILTNTNILNKQQ